MNGIRKIREPLVNGLFYPSRREELKEAISGFLDMESNFSANSFAIISPHACLEYAGTIMAAAYKSASKRKIDTVVILAPQHRENYDEIILPESDFFKTPLGLVKTNKDIIEELLSCSNFIIRNDIPHLEEHCIEVQLPFIQTLYPEADIVPVLMNRSKPRNVKLLSNALQLVFSGKFNTTLFVISANIAYSHTKKKSIDKEAELFIKLLLEKDWKGIQESMIKKKISTCGADCISAILCFKDINFNIELLKQDNSKKKDPYGDSNVHYAAISLRLIE